MNRILSIIAAAVVAVAPCAVNAADKADKKAEKKALIQGTVKTIEPKANTITITLKGKKGQPGEDKSFTLAADAKIVADGKPGKLDAIKAGVQAQLKLSEDGKSVAALSVGEKKPGKPDKGKAVEVKSVDAAANSITVVIKEKEKTLTVAANAKITIDGKEAKLADVKAGMKVSVQLGDGKQITAISTPVK